MDHSVEKQKEKGVATAAAAAQAAMNASRTPLPDSRCTHHAVAADARLYRCTSRARRLEPDCARDGSLPHHKAP
jgi:hypothetical protein